MTVIRAHERATKVAPQDNFVGQVWQDEVIVGAKPSRMRATNVSFSPGARTAWHAHPVGQTLYVISGVGRLQLEGQQVQELRPGDTGIIPPNTRHWHGAAADRFFVHLAMSETDDDGGGTQWFEQVDEVDYQAPTA
ncbi:MAG: cupin domain-containing protein [Gammaproteobacteria bacterium]|nr:cupin domain-containing protein [Gammaproteobacteria bacterium]